MLKTTTLLITLFLLGCNLQEGREIDPRLEGAVKMWEKDTGYRVDFPIRIVDHIGGKDVRGRCYHWPNKKVEVTQDYFDQNSDFEVQMVPMVYHELGHCVFDLEHVDHSFDKDGNPVSFMSKTTPNYWDYSVDLDYYIAEYLDRAGIQYYE